MTFRKAVLAYLTGWLIVQPAFAAARRWWLKREMAHPSEETRQHYEHQAKAVVNELTWRGTLAAPVAHEVIRAQAEEIKRLREQLGASA